MHPSPIDFWDRPDIVDRFTNRDPDKRLMALIEARSDPSRLSAMDIGCAAGRNMVFLAEAGVDAYGIDSAAAMVMRTRQRLAPRIGTAEAERRVRVGQMDHLEAFEPDRFDLVVALGVLHQARSDQEWTAAVTEWYRVCRPHGLLLVAAFAPDSRPRGVVLQQDSREPHVYHGFDSGPHLLLDGPTLDTRMRDLGFRPVETTRAVHVQKGGSSRVTVNALYAAD